ncbi:MAG: S8 family serine peptidase [Eubacterium sp.]
MLFVCAAGNSNLNLDNQSLFPCSYDLDNIITVMAVDNKGLPYNSSGYGENGVDIAAPGVNVKTTLPDDEETLISGTSVASAYVSGTAALLLSQNPKLTPVDIKEILIENSHKINDLKSKCKSKGIIDVSASFQAGMKYKEDDK